MPSPSGSTPLYGFPYPESGDSPDIPTWGQELATAVEDVIAGLTVLESRTYAVSGLIAVGSGATNYLPPFFEPVASDSTKTLLAVRYVVRAGTSVTFAVEHNGSTVSGLSSLSATTTAATTNATTPPTVANGDSFDIVVASISGTPDGLSVSFFFQTVA